MHCPPVGRAEQAGQAGATMLCKAMKNMRKYMKKSALFIMLAALLSIVIIGCKAGATDSLGDETDNELDLQEYVYVAETITFPSDIESVDNFTFSEDKLYFSSVDNHEVTQYVNARSVKLYSMNVDGTGFAELPNYLSPITMSAEVYADVFISDMCADGNGGLWVIESLHLYRYEFPHDFIAESGNLWEYRVELGSGNTVRNLDSTGAELFSLDLSGISERQDNYYINAIGVDDFGNIYLGAADKNGDSAIFVFDSIGNLQFKLSWDGWIERFLRLSDGSVAIPVEAIDEIGKSVRILQKIDYEAQAFGEKIHIPDINGDIYSGDNGYDILVSSHDNLYGFTIDEENPDILLNWLECGIINWGYMSSITMASDGRIFCTNIWEHFILLKTPLSQIVQKTELTLATFGADNILRSAVVAFNRANREYNIRVIDYSDFNTGDDNSAGFLRFTTEIASGNIPDIMDVSYLPYSEYARKGLFTDLYPFIDADPEISRNDFVAGALNAAEINGELFQVFPAFYVKTVVGHPAVLGYEHGWNMYELESVLEANPEADVPFGQHYDRMSFFRQIVSFNINEYIDWETGKTRFESSDFVSLLEFIGTFPDEPFWQREAVTMETAVAMGRTIMITAELHGVDTIAWHKSLFGGELVYKGFPNESRNGSSLVVRLGLAIAENSECKEAAWAFIRTFLSKEWQLGGYNTTFAFPSNAAAFEERLQKSLSEDYSDFATDTGVLPIALTQAEVNQFTALVNSLSFITESVEVSNQIILDIVCEGASDYFNGMKSAEEVAEIIQSRVSILVSERS